MRLATQNRIVAGIASLALAGLVIESGSAGVRAWLGARPLTSGIIVGALLIGATYLIVERALAERERDRWARASGSLLRGIARAGMATDETLREAELTGRRDRACLQADWLAQMLDDNQAALSGTAELMGRWHIAYSLAQHARAVLARDPLAADAAYEEAWSRFREAFEDVHDFTRVSGGDDATWSAMPVVTREEGMR